MNTLWELKGQQCKKKLNISKKGFFINRPYEILSKSSKSLVPAGHTAHKKRYQVKFSVDAAPNTRYELRLWHIETIETESLIYMTSRDILEEIVWLQAVPGLGRDVPASIRKIGVKLPFVGESNSPDKV